MRIGEFASKHNTTIDTIRYYLELGLLVSEKAGGHYRFNHNDSWDLEKIFELKQLDFPLSKIQELLSYHRLAGDSNAEYRKYYVSLLMSQKDHFQDELSRYRDMEALIDDKIMKFQSELDEVTRIGIPLSFLEILTCPKCHRDLEISNGSLEKNMIISGEIECQCGYSATIDNGTYIDRSLVDTELSDKRKLPSKREFLHMASAKFINFYYNGMAKLIGYMDKYMEEPGLILELDTCVGSFLMQYLKHLHPSSKYILTCKDRKRLMDMKKNVESNYQYNNIIFLCCNIENLPIRESTIDMIVDHGMSKEFSRSYNRSLYDLILSLLKEKGI
ncbi:MAG: MerR family transcriptional regulator, partial [Tissierellaceae bacterium]